MKTTLLIICCAVIGTATGFLGARLAGSDSVANSTPPALEPADHAPDLSGTVAALETEVRDLRYQMRGLEAGIARESVPDDEAEAAPREVVTPAIAERERILGVLEQENERKRHERDLARATKVEGEIQRRSGRIADELGLASGSDLKIATVFLEEREKIETLRDTYRSAERDESSRRMLRDGMAEIRDWRVAQFTTLFGQEGAESIANFGDKAALKAAGLDPSEMEGRGRKYSKKKDGKKNKNR